MQAANAERAVVIGVLPPAVPAREVLPDTALQLLCFAPAGRRIAFVTLGLIQFITPRHAAALRAAAAP
ncbi:hypothetical protein BA895_10600 [Humibacillus sp. DSM 29435]|nr:hypothetical protein BA895_10600 [Humibacillus sp. DSM 29435]